MPGFARVRDAYDLAILGGGHAGLQAGLKAALLGHSALIVDRGPKYSRSYYAPKMDNIPGFPNGISGHNLLDLQIAAVRALDEAVTYVTPALAHAVEREPSGGFRVEFDWLKQPRTVRARAVLLALGVVDRIPEIEGKIDPIFPWANQGIVDFCIFCDGHTMPGKSVAVIGSGAEAARTAIDLLHFRPKSLELLTHGHPLLEGVVEPERAELAATLSARGVSHAEGEIVGFDGIREKRFHVRFRDGSTREYDKGFSAVGWFTLHPEIPRSLGCRLDADGYVTTDEDCRTLAEADGKPIPGLYAVGDLRNGWNQIPEAWATAERAVIHAYSYYL